MDGRESTVTSGTNFSSFYVQHRGMGVPGAAGLHGPPPGGYRQHLDAVSAGYTFQPPHIGGSHIGQGYHHVEASSPVAQHSAGGGGAGGSMDIGMAVAVSADAKGDHGSGAGQDGQVKKKRGRPRKYKPDGAVTLGLSPSSSMPHSSSSGMGTMVSTPGSGFGSGTGSGGSGSAPTEKRARGRPPGSGKMQQLASLGKWFLGSVGTGFTPHVIIISPGEDVAARIMSFSQQGPRAVCIISATGAVSTATLRQDSNSGGVVTYEVFLPINIEKFHWYLAVVNAKKCEIHVLDSFGRELSDRRDLKTTQPVRLPYIQFHVVVEWRKITSYQHSISFIEDEFIGGHFEEQ